MIALQSLLVVLGMALVSYALSILLYKNKDKDGLGNSKGGGKPFAQGKQLPSSTGNQRVME